ncbi:hypothetical protein BGW42_003440 [Actinomortierella wolfii]|nr:hypothetical protein BGW42_003440 [Actinomortierella wolfii]
MNIGAMMVDNRESLDDLMEATFDFNSLSLDSPDDKLEKDSVKGYINHESVSYSISGNELHAQPQLPSWVGHGVEPSRPQNPEMVVEVAQEVNQQEATNLSPGDKNPFQPGINAEILDAKAADPTYLHNHKFATSTASDILPETAPSQLGIVNLDEYLANTDKQASTKPTQFGSSHYTGALVSETSTSNPLVDKEDHTVVDEWSSDSSWLLPLDLSTSAPFEEAGALNAQTAVDHNASLESTQGLFRERFDADRWNGQQLPLEDKTSSKDKAISLQQEETLKAEDVQMQEVHGQLHQQQQRKSNGGSFEANYSTPLETQSTTGPQSHHPNNSDFSFSFEMPFISTSLSSGTGGYQETTHSIKIPSLSRSFQTQASLATLPINHDFGFDEEYDIEHAINAPPKIAASKSFAPALYRHESDVEGPRH